MNSIKKVVLTLLLAMLLVVSFANIVTASPPPQILTEEDKILVNNALQFLTDVANINTSSYQTKVHVANGAPGVYSGKTLKFNLSSATSLLDVLAEFTYGKLFWCTIRPIKGSPALNHPASSDVLNAAKDTLDKLQAFSARDYLPTFQNMLNSITELQNSKTTNGGYTQEIATSGNTLKISWEPFANGLSNPQNKLTFEFKNGNLEFFCNYLDMYQIGSSEVKISEEQAIQIAAERARAFSWAQDNETVSNVTVLDKIAIASISLQNRGNNTLYPKWNILLPLDKEYPGGITAFRATIWADTGEISYFTPIGFYGDPIAVPPSEPQQTPTPTTQGASENNQAAAPDSFIIGAAIVATTIIIIVGYLFYKRKR
jgi:hypothetical protein